MGMVYAVRLADGSFIVVDGGMPAYGNADRLYNALKEYSNDEKPVIAAWLITHGHEDHIGGLTTFVEKYYEADKPGTALLVDGDGRDGMQGGGTDGKYAYYALYEDDIANIYKFDLRDWTLVDVSDALPTGHSNDITYVPEKNVLMVADCTEKDGWAGVYYVDPDTLELLNYGILPYGCRGLDYSPVLQQYVVTGSYTHNIYDKDFNHIRSFNCGFPRDTTQGLYCDGSYVYDSRWGDYTGPDYSGDNRLLIHSIDGEFISEGIIKGDPCKGNSENENVFIYENMFYVGYYNSPRTVNEYVMVPVNMFE
jgi:hypothetical protein